MGILLSVVVCTYNRVKLLDILLKSLSRQDINKRFVEILIVDNKSNDGTEKSVQKNIFKYPKIRIIYIKENKVGLSNARNRGIRESKGEFVSFLDDDSYVSDDWVRKVSACLKQIDRRTICIGGPIYSYYQSDKPDWYKDEYASDLSKGNRQRYLKKGESFSGSNMIWKRDVLIRHGGFREDVGMKGDLLSVGEETGLFENIWRETGERNLFLYIPDIVVYHLVPKEKMTVKYRLKRWFISGQSVCLRLKKTNSAGLFIYSIKISGYLLINILLSVVMIMKYRRIENWLVERIGPFYYISGYFSVLIGLNIEIKNEQTI